MSCFDTAWVTGKSRVPEPPARMIPFIPSPLAPGDDLRAFLDGPPPGFVVPVPGDGPFDALLEGDGRPPAQLVADLAGVDGVGAVVVGAAGHGPGHGTGKAGGGQDG